jgi:hypothetical protein
MANQGRPRKPTALHILQNTSNSTRHADRVGEPVSGGRPVPPAPLDEREMELWNKFIATAFWLGEHDAPKAFLWAKLHAEFERDPTMIAARITQLRSIGSELGLDPSSRSRMGATNPTAKDPYFD